MNAMGDEESAKAACDKIDEDNLDEIHDECVGRKPGKARLNCLNDGSDRLLGPLVDFLLVATTLTQSSATLALLGPTVGAFVQTQTRMVIFTYVLYFYDSLGKPIAKFAMTDEDHVGLGKAAKEAKKSEKAEWAADQTPGKVKKA